MQTKTDTCFTNDLGVTGIGDPYVLKTAQGEYYMYCTSATNGFYCWKSGDLVHWGEKKMCYIRRPDAWCTACFWAPEVICADHRYYMFYTAKNQAGSLRIGLAVSTAPDGPFEDVKNEPLFDFGYAAIDANVFTDDDQKSYLYYSRDCSENRDGNLKKSEIYGVSLSADLLSTKGEAVKLLTPEQPWEKASGDTWWNEGPEMIKHNGRYYLTYSANFFASPSYSLGYAVSDTPLGPFQKAQENPLLTSGERQDVSGTGHHSFTYSPDGTQLWAVYHSHTDLANPSGDRKVNIDRAGFTPDGKLFLCGPTTTPQPAPSGGITVDVTGHFKAHFNGPDSSSQQPSPEMALLTDGLFSVHAEHAWLETAFPADNGRLHLTLTAADKLPVCGVAIYPGAGCENTITSISLHLGGRPTQEFIADKKAVPFLLYFDACETDRIEITLTLRPGMESIKLSEITVLAKN